jgi:hypothetical protein
MKRLEYWCCIKSDPWDRPCKYMDVDLSKSPCCKCNSFERDDFHKRPSQWKPRRPLNTKVAARRRGGILRPKPKP